MIQICEVFKSRGTRIWLGFETEGCRNSRQCVGCVMNVSLFSIFFTHSFSLFFHILSHFPFFRLPPSQFVMTPFSPSISHIQAFLSFSFWPLSMYSFCYSLNQMSVIIPHPKHLSFAKPLLMFLLSYYLFSSIPNSVMSAILMQQ